MSKKREDVNPSDKWNVEALYPSLEAWNQEFETFCEPEKEIHWPLISKYKGQLNKSANYLVETFENLFKTDRTLSKLYTFAHLKHDEEMTQDTYKQAYIKITAMIHAFSQEVSWLDPEILSLSDQTIQDYLESEALKPYQFYLEKIVRLKKHTLSQSEEALLALSGRAMQSSQKAFSAINDADFEFGTVEDENGEQKELTHGLFSQYLHQKDRVLRKNAFEKVHQTYQSYENTLCELIGGNVETHLFRAKARRYNSCLEAALFPKNIDLSVYRSLIQAVRDNIPKLHNYFRLRKELLGYDTLHLHDMHLPLIQNVEMNISYEEAEDLVIQSSAPLGDEYQNLLKKGLKQERWVDRYENKHKRSGAYSSGCFDSMPYILMNYKGLLKDVFTLAHEAGHSMHSLLSRTHQPYHYSDYPIFVAEVASTFNEELLIQLMIQNAKTKEEKAYLINQKIDDIRATLFRQTMFAEFELLIHTMAEKNVPLTPQFLKEQYYKLNEFYFGDSVEVDETIAIEWARIPHFYYNFYVYQYATGISAALALSQKVLKGGKSEQEAYLNFLKGGSCKYPIDLLVDAGVDMRSKEPVEAAIKHFDHLVKELENLSLTSC